MKRKDNSKKILWAILSIFVIVLFTGLQSQYNFLNLSSDKSLAAVPTDLDQYVGRCSGGFTTLSTSDVNIVPQGDRIRVFGIAKGSECLKIEFRQSDLDAKLKSAGLDATKDVVGNIKLLEYTKSFPISQTGTFKGNLNNVVVPNTKLTNTNLQNCKDKGYPNAILAYKPVPLVTDLRCVVPGTNGIAGDFTGTSYGNFKVQFDFDGASIVITGRPTSEGEVQQSASLRNGDIRIEWVGLLGNLDDVGTPQYDARLINSKWDLVDSGTLGQVDRLLSEFKSCLTQGQTVDKIYISDGSFDNCKSRFDSAVSPYLQSKLSQYQSSVGNLVYDSSTDSNALYVSLKAPPFPAFIIDLNAKSVGIIALEGNPKITQCISSQNLQSGTNQLVSYSVTNDGAANNVEFLSSIICSQGISPYSTNFNINANEQKTLTAELIPSNPNQQVLVSSCTLTVKDQKSGKSTSCSFSGNVEYVSGILCQANSLSCSDDGKNVVQCSSDGKNKVLKTECNIGCVIDSSSGGAKCISQQPDSGGNGFWDKIKDFFDGFLSGVQLVRTLISIGVFIVATLFSHDALVKKFRSMRRKEWIAWIIAIVLSGIIAGITFNFFWFGVAAVVVLGIIRVVIKR